MAFDPTGRSGKATAAGSPSHFDPDVVAVFGSGQPSKWTTGTAKNVKNVGPEMLRNRNPDGKSNNAE